MTVDETTKHRRGYRRVLHEWAARQLEQYGHLGPFDILGVHVYHERGCGSPDTPADDYVSVSIRFRHPGGCPTWSRPEWPCQSESSWGMPDTTSTVKMLNELLAIADEVDDELPAEERPPVGSRWWHRWGKWLTITETPNERGWPADEVAAVDDAGQQYGVKIKSLSSPDDMDDPGHEVWEHYPNSPSDYGDFVSRERCVKCNQIWPCWTAQNRPGADAWNKVQS